MKIEDYSDIDHLLRVTARVLLFTRKLKRQTVAVNELITEAETLWSRESQVNLSTETNFKLYEGQLSLFLDPQGVWHCSARLHNAEIPYSTKFPILLSRKHWFTTLVVRRAHRRVFHNGVKETLTEIRSAYWILKGRSVVKQVIYKCVVCRRFEAKPYSAPPPPLPEFR